MAVGNAYNVYKNNSVNFASKEQLLLMLVDGAVKYAKIGKQALEDKDIKKAHENIVRTQDIFYELIATLDVEQGGEWASALMKVYEYINSQLLQANIKKDPSIMAQIMPLIEDVRDTWNEAYKISKGMK
jgi:flagellar protein FliS